VVNKYIETNPIFSVTCQRQPDELRQQIKTQQHDNMKYFIDVDGRKITTNSTMVVATVRLRGIISDMTMTTDNYTKAEVKEGTPNCNVEEAVNSGIDMQLKTDHRQLFLCEVNATDITDDQVAEAKESADKRRDQNDNTMTWTCQYDSDDKVDEIAWDDVNNCKLDPVKVKDARQAEMDYFRRMKVYQKVPIQKCKDLTGKMPIKVRWIDTNKQDEANPKCRSRLVAKDFKR
jgi:hypothetical protein